MKRKKLNLQKKKHFCKTQPNQQEVIAGNWLLQQKTAKMLQESTKFFMRSPKQGVAMDSVQYTTKYCMWYNIYGIKSRNLKQEWLWVCI